jgi:hypothetical protein
LALPFVVVGVVSVRELGAAETALMFAVCGAATGIICLGAWLVTG